MLRYAIQADKMNELMQLMHRVFDLRITFFDLQDCELDDFDIKEMSPFCRFCRRDEAFDRQCVGCDQENLALAKKQGNMRVYHCHSGLLEGIVPLYDRHRVYLGAVVFGQLRDRERDYRGMPEARRKLLAKSREASLKEMRDVGELLKCLSEYIIENELIKHQSKPWVERVDAYIHSHLDQRLTLSRLAAEIGRSTSFLSHNFAREFGVPVKAYIKQERLAHAKELLAAGHSVKETANRLGYYDAFHFSKEFKRLTGSPPSHFKR